MSEKLIYIQMNKIVAQADGLTKDQQNKQQGFNIVVLMMRTIICMTFLRNTMYSRFPE